MSTWLVACAALAAVAANGGTNPGAGEPRPVEALLDAQVEFLMRENPEWASTRGDLRFNDALRDESPAAYARRVEHTRAMLERAEAIDAAGLTAEDRLNLSLLMYELRLNLDGERFRFEQMPVTAIDGPHIWLPQLAERVPMRTREQMAQYVARLEKVPTALDQAIEQMRAGLAAGRTPPRVVLRRASTAARAQVTPEIVRQPSLSPFYRPLARLGAEDELAQRARRAVADGILPAFERFAKFLDEEYVPQARQSLGASASVDGPALYEYALRQHTTTTLSAREIHEIGLAEVARIRREMLETIERTDWPGKAQHGYDPAQPESAAAEARLEAFLAYLRTDARFYARSEEELLRGYRDLSKRIDPEMPRLFRTLPRNTYGVRPIPRFAAPTSPAAYYYPGSVKSGVPGYFMVNTHALDQRPLYGMVSLTLHEAVPGHHFQIALADELEDQHEYRSLLGYTAYVEGWALYAERLGLEMGDRPQTREDPAGRGLYADPYDDFGRLSDEIWRASRLVVDTGLHAFGWTREQAIEYMLKNTAGTELDSISEVDRYIGWPGQACAYKIGELEIRRLRAEAEAALGARFDVRLFHDCVLTAGALPLPVLRERVSAWIASEAGRGSEDARR